MSKIQDVSELIDINKRKGFPRTYYENRFVRYFVLLTALFVIYFAIDTMLHRVAADTSVWMKFLPIVMLFLALDSINRNVRSIHAIVFNQEAMKVRFLFTKAIHIPFDKIVAISFIKAKINSLKVVWNDEGKEREFLLPINFPRMLEILNAICEMNRSIQLDDFMQSVIIAPEDVEKYKETIAGKDKAESETE